MRPADQKRYDEAIRLYTECGYTLEKCHETTFVSIERLSKILHEMGVFKSKNNMSKYNITKEQLEHFIGLKMDAREISEALFVSKTTVYKLLRKHGLKIDPAAYQKNKESKMVTAINPEDTYEYDLPDRFHRCRQCGKIFYIADVKCWVPKVTLNNGRPYYFCKCSHKAEWKKAHNYKGEKI